MKELVFASGNLHKLREVKEVLGDQYKVLGLADIGCKEEIPETAHTLDGNALQKARYVKEKYGFDCFADDTGLEVEALNGEPGVYSARYAGENASFDDNVQKMLKAMNGLENRKARFRTVISLILNDKQLFFEGICEGQIEESFMARVAMQSRA